MDLPDDWYIEHDGQQEVLDAEKVKAEIERLRAALEELRVLGIQGAPPDYTRWLAFHDQVAEIAKRGLGLVEQTGDKT